MRSRTIAPPMIINNRRSMKKQLSILYLLMFPLIIEAAYAQTIRPDLTASRLSGAAPLAVFFESTATTCGPNCNAFHDLLHEWNFGDPQSGTWEFSGKSKNTAFGPTTAHVFDKPGSYTVTVTITSADNQTVSRNVVINVQDPNAVWAGNATRCFSNNSDFTACPANAIHVTTGSLTEASSQCNGGNRCLFRRGHVFTGRLRVGGETGLVGAFGAGTQPAIFPASNDGEGVSVNGGSRDWRIMEIRVGDTASPAGQVVGVSGRVEELLIYRTSNLPNGISSGLIFSYSLLSQRGEALHDGFYVVENRFTNVGHNGNNGMFIATGHLAILGNFIDNIINRAEHVIRIQHGEVGVVSHNNLGRQNVAKGVLTIRSADQNATCSAACGQPTRDFTISDNTLRAGLGGVTMNFVARNKSTETSAGENFLVERNFIMRDPRSDAAVQVGIQSGNVTGATIRNNIILMNGWAFYRGMELGGSNVRAYNNSCFTADNPSTTVHCSRFGANNFNNLVYTPNTNNTSVVSGGDLGGNIIASRNPFIAADPSGPEDFLLRDGSEAIGVAINQAPINPVDFFLRRGATLKTPDSGAVRYDGMNPGPEPTPGPGPAPPPPPPPTQTDLVVAKLVAYRVDTDQVIYDPFTGGQDQPLSLDPGFALCAVVEGEDEVGSVRFILDDEITGTEQIFPYCQNDEDRDYRQYEEITAPGNYLLNSVTPYTERLAQGLAGQSLDNIQLVVTAGDNSPTRPNPPQLISVDP